MRLGIGEFVNDSARARRRAGPSGAKKPTAPPEQRAHAGTKRDEPGWRRRVLSTPLGARVGRARAGLQAGVRRVASSSPLGTLIPMRAGDSPADQADLGAIRDPLASRAAVLAARQRPMAERLEVALSWNLLASELRAGLVVAADHTESSR
jgi:hypothetical protein